jgi:hypothetical protein
MDGHRPAVAVFTSEEIGDSSLAHDVSVVVFHLAASAERQARLLLRLGFTVGQVSALSRSGTQQRFGRRSGSVNYSAR